MLSNMLKKIQPFLYQVRDEQIETLKAEILALKANRVTVVVSGGAVTSVHSAAPIDVAVIDFDRANLSTREAEAEFAKVCAEFPISFVP